MASSMMHRYSKRIGPGITGLGPNGSLLFSIVNWTNYSSTLLEVDHECKVTNMVGFLLDCVVVTNSQNTLLACFHHKNKFSFGSCKL